MQTFRKIGEGILLGGIIFLFFLLVFEKRLHIPPWLQVIGRMHPMFLHFPIVLLLLSFLTFWMPTREQNNALFNVLRLVAALSAMVTAIMGLLLSLEDQRTGNLLQWHKWCGVTIAFCGFLFYVFHRFFTIHNISGRSFTVLASIGIIFTGHFGANLTRGENYLLAPVEKYEKKVVPVNQAVVFTDVIKPVFEKKCFSCHGEANRKGGLLLEDTAGVLDGGKTGPLFIAGDPFKSLLIHRILLPPEDKKHMPPISKPALANDEIALLQAWIKSGALLNRKLVTLPPQDTFRILAAKFLGTSDEIPGQVQYDFAAADEKTINGLNNNNRVIEPQGMGSPALSVHFYGKSAYSHKALEGLRALKQQMISLSLARMPVKDDDLSIISQMSNLRTLNLNYTDVTSKGLEQLAKLKKLQEVALAGTAIDLPTIQRLASLPGITSIYIWNTKTDSTKLAAIRNKFRKVHIETGYVDNGQLIELSPPSIQTPSGVFDQVATVELKHPFKGVDIRYTLDGTAPDSVKSAVYKEPLQLGNTATLIARAFKDGWYGSTPVKATYIKRGVKPDSVELITQPDPKYKLTKDSLLSDGDLGDVNFGNGQWLGYQKNEAAFYLRFNNVVTVKNVLLNMLQHTGSSIFPPVSLEVWGGMEKDQLKLLGKINPVMPLKDQPPGLLLERVDFPPANVKCLKVVAQPLQALPAWHPSKTKPAWVFISEIVVN